MGVTLDNYIEELKVDTRVDAFNLKDVQMALPAIKHKWAGRLIRAKQDILKLETERKKKKESLIKRLQEQSPITLSEVAAGKTIECHELLSEIDNKIKEFKLVIELLEETKKTLSAMTFDIKNIVEIIKLETT